MAVESVQTGGQAFSGQAQQGIPGTLELVKRLGRFEGPPEQFLINLLAVQCHLCAAMGGAILRPGAQGRPELLAAYPPLPQNTTPPVWLAQAAEAMPSALNSEVTQVRPVRTQDELYGQPAKHYLIMLPLTGGTGVRGVSAFYIEARDPAVLNAVKERLELSSSLLSIYEMRLTLQRKNIDLQRIRMAMETLSAVNNNQRFAGAAFALCNEVSDRWKCLRVSIGFLKGRYVHMKALSHTEKFSRKQKMVQDIESAMEECLDQDIEIIYPQAADASYVYRAAQELSNKHGPSVILCMPLRQSGEVMGVLALERPIDQPFSLEDTESLRLACDLCTARLVNLYDQDKWFGAKAAATTRKGLALAVGPKYTWVKLLAIGIIGLLVFAFLAKGKYQAEANFTIEPLRKQVVPAPYESFIATVGKVRDPKTGELKDVEPGVEIVGGENGTVLATLDTHQLELKRLDAFKEQTKHEILASSADKDDKASDAKAERAQAQQAAAQVQLYDLQIAQGVLRSQISGTIIAGDLRRQIGAPVKTGDVLFEIAPISTMRGELAVPEEQIADVKDGQDGELAVAGYPSQKFKFVVEKINPMAEAVEQNNIFKVRAKFVDAPPDWLRPGMKGVAKIDIGEKRYYWLWTHKIVDWVRTKLWI
jgi:multidrug efflux pump subunit AcrA (membrane-fusion protein)